MLPNFLLIGAAKSGTTALQRYLGAHPQIFLCPRKDTNFFAWSPDAPGVAEEIPQQFPIREVAAYEALFEGAEGARAVGEVSTYYLESAVAPVRIGELVPEARIVAILRDPVERAYSGYVMRCRMGREARGIDEALVPESHYVRTSRYAAFLAHYERFLRAGQVHVLLLEEFRAEPRRVFRELLEFLSVDPSFEPDFSTRHNVGGIPRNRTLHRLYTHPLLRATALPLLAGPLRRWATKLRNRNMQPAPPLPDVTRTRLREHLRDDVEHLERLLGRDVRGAWNF